MTNFTAEPGETSLFVDAFTSISVDDVAKAKEFYGTTLGLATTGEEEGLALKLPGGGKMFIYPKDNHVAATFTVLNLQVKDIDAAVEDLTQRGIAFESYTGDIATDEKGIYRGAEQGSGPNIAWFKDPAGNILSVIED
ncbi:MAG: VOC family protein [Pyrinomonadaceae bacterium]